MLSLYLSYTENCVIIHWFQFDKNEYKSLLTLTILFKEITEKLLSTINSGFQILNFKFTDLKSIYLNLGPSTWNSMRLVVLTAQFYSHYFAIPCYAISNIKYHYLALNKNLYLPGKQQKFFHGWFDGYWKEELYSKTPLIIDNYLSLIEHINFFPKIIHNFKLTNPKELEPNYLLFPIYD